MPTKSQEFLMTSKQREALLSEATKWESRADWFRQLGDMASVAKCQSKASDLRSKLHRVHQ